MLFRKLPNGLERHKNRFCGSSQNIERENSKEVYLKQTNVTGPVSATESALATSVQTRQPRRISQKLTRLVRVLADPG